KGDVVALLMENRPEYLFAWTGLVKIGAVAALINTNLREKALAHSIAVAEARHLILGAELAENYATCLDELSAPIKTWTTGGALQGTENLDAALAAQSPDRLSADVRAGLTAGDKCFYIYTSGTTGLPKAANMSHLRIQNMMHSFAAAMKSTERDRMYVV